MDAVITWVDGSDPAHAKKRAVYAGQDDVHAHARATNRFDSLGEIYFCIASILKFARHINRIHIVTDSQTPKELDRFWKEGLCEPDQIKIVDHQTIFKGNEDALPCFNSVSIETLLWRIPDLEEEFVYFNDDFFLNRPSSAKDFFVDGSPIPRIEKWSKFRNPIVKGAIVASDRLFKTSLLRPSWRHAQEKAAKLAGYSGRYLQLAHAPYPLRKSVFGEYFSLNPIGLKAQVRHRFRDVEQFQPLSLASHLELNKNADLTLADPDLLYIVAPKGVSEAQLNDLANGQSAFGCIQGLGQADQTTRKRLSQVLAKKFESHLPVGLGL